MGFSKLTLPLEIMHRGHTWHDYPWPWVCLTWLLYNLQLDDVTGSDFENSLYPFGQSLYAFGQSVVIICCAADIRHLFKILLKFRNVLEHTESRSSLACNQNVKDLKKNPHSFGGFPSLWNGIKRNINKSPTNTSTQSASNIRGRTGYHV